MGVFWIPFFVLHLLLYLAPADPFAIIPNPIVRTQNNRLLQSGKRLANIDECTVTSRPAGCVVLLFPLSYSPAHRICLPSVPDKRASRWPRPDPPGPRERSHSAAGGRPKNGRKWRVPGKGTEMKNMRFCQVRFCGDHGVRPSFWAYFPARFGRAALSNLLLESQEESGHSRGNQT